MNCASDKCFSVHSTGGPDIFGGCVRALDLLRGRRAARFHFAAAEAGSKKHCSEFKRSSISGQFRDRRAGENLCLSRQSRRTVEGGCRRKSKRFSRFHSSIKFSRNFRPKRRPCGVFRNPAPNGPSKFINLQNCRKRI